MVLAISTGASAADLQTMRAHFDCGWWEYLKSGEEEVVGAAEYHIVTAGSYSADLGQNRADLETEGRMASERVYLLIGKHEYDGKMSAFCVGMRLEGK
jgi:hypothetical protein